MDYFSSFVWARGYAQANQAAAHQMWIDLIVPVFGFPRCVYNDNGTHFTGYEIITYFGSHRTTQITAPIMDPSSVGLVERNVQLITSQIRKWVLDRGPRAKEHLARKCKSSIPCPLEPTASTRITSEEVSYLKLRQFKKNWRPAAARHSCTQL